MADNTVQTRIPRQLRESDTHGKGAAEIGWGTPGDFKRCQLFMRRHGVPGHEIDGACANLHKLATGEWPGKNAHKGHLATAAVISLTAAMGDYTPIRWEGPLAHIEKPTGDRRRFPRDTLTYQSFPQPLRWQKQGLPGHTGAVTVGVIEHAEEKDHEGQRVVWGHGYFLDPNVIPEVNEAVHQVEHGVSGPSVDLDSYTAVLKKNALSGETTADMVRGRQRAATLVSVPAFADLRIKVIRPDAAMTASMQEFTVNAAGWHGAPIAPREALFNADDAAKRIEGWANGDPAKMAKMFLWVDTANGPLLGRKGYRLPWGDIIDDKPYLIYHAVYAAAALLAGGHGGLPNIPEEEKGHLRTVISSIYETLAKEFGDPSIIAPWDRRAAQAQQASGEPEEFARTHRYVERKHPRWPGKPGGRVNPAPNPKGGEWVDTPHGPHGQIKVGGKWIYPPKRGEKGWRNPESAVRGIAKRGGGSGHSRTHVVKKAAPHHEEHHREHHEAPKKAEHHEAPKAKKPEHHKAPADRAAAKPQAHKAPETTVAKKPRAHKVSPAQERFLEQFRDNETVEADENNATVKVLEREGYIEKTGRRRAPVAKKTATTKKAPAKKAPAKKAAEGNGESVGEGGEGGGGTTTKKPATKKTGTTVAKKTPVAKREKTEYRLTQKGRDHLGIKPEEPKKPEEPGNTLISERVTLRMVRDRGDEGMAMTDPHLTPVARGQLRDLESRGLLETRRHGQQERFHLTDKGHAALKGHEHEEPKGPPSPPKKRGTTVGKKTPAGPKAFTPNLAQEKALRDIQAGGKGHPASRKVLEREGYVDSSGNLTQKGRDHLGIKGEEPKKPEAPKAPPKPAPNPEEPQKKGRPTLGSIFSESSPRPMPKLPKLPKNPNTEGPLRSKVQSQRQRELELAQGRLARFEASKESYAKGWRDSLDRAKREGGDTGYFERGLAALEDQHEEYRQEIRRIKAIPRDDNYYDKPREVPYSKAGTPTAAQVKQHVRDIVDTRVPKRYHAQVEGQLVHQGSIAPRSLATLRKINFPRSSDDGHLFNDPGYGNALAYYQSHSREISVNPRWESNPYEMFDSSVSSSRDGWWVPTEDGTAPLEQILAHEFGHHVAYRALANTRSEDLLRAIVKEYELPSTTRLNTEDVASALRIRAGRIGKELSVYGTHSLQEFLAEVWAEYTNGGGYTRPKVRRIAELVRELAEGTSIA